MLKTIAPLTTRLRHLLPAPVRRPSVVKRHAVSDAEPLTFGQHLAEVLASALGSWRFIGAQAAVMALWVLINTLPTFHALEFDRYPYTFLNLAMSAEAAFTGPILLIAAIVGAMRDHAQADRVERLVAQNEQLTERLAQLEETILARLDHRLASAPSPAPVVERAPTPRRRRIRKAATAEE